jgi:uncharacterized protein (TIGR03435 family)
MKNKILLIIITLLGSNVASSQNELVVGKMAPNINITDYIFNTPSDKNFKNKFILLEFWATWCGPCLEEVPSLNKLQEKFKSKKDFVFISITNEKPDKVLRTLKRIPFNSIVVSDQTGKTFKNFIEDKDGSYSIPKTILIDNKGIVKWIGSPYDLNDLILDKFINMKGLSVLDNSISNRPPDPIFIKPSEEKITDIAYKMIYNEATLYSFTLLNGNKNEFNMNFNNLRAEGLYFDLNKNLISIISNLSNVLESQIILPENLKEHNYSLFFKNKNFITQNESKLDIKINLLKSLHLTENVIHKNTDVYVLKVKNKNKLEEILNETEVKNGYNGTHFLFSNVDIDVTIKSISFYYKIIIKDKTNLKGKYDFILKNNSLEDMIKDLEIYGLSLDKINEDVEFYKYE